LKFVTFRVGDCTRLGVVDNDAVIDVNAANPELPASLLDALAQEVDIRVAGAAVLDSRAARVPLRNLLLAPAIPQPRKIICLGLNYFDHAKEGGRDKPEYPWFFLRAASSLIAHEQAAALPRVSVQLDYEAELAVVIGSQVPRHVAHAESLKYVFGYSCFNDFSVRDYQRKTPQWTIGKNFDGTGAFGPFVVTSDELPPGGGGLRIQGRLNGFAMQYANTDDMIFTVPETIALLSECMTLDSGDVIVMGTPAGVGAARKPQVWLAEGDVFEVEIERVGVLVNTVRKEDDLGISRASLKALR
jgi:acylpyruvate hydrolase